MVTFEEIENSLENIKASEKEISAIMNTSAQKIFSLFGNILYFSSDDEVSLKNGYIIKYSDSGINLLQMIETKVRWKKDLIYDHLLQLNKSKLGDISLVYSMDSLAKIFEAIEIAKEYLTINFNTKQAELNDTLKTAKKITGALIDVN